MRVRLAALLIVWSTFVQGAPPAARPAPRLSPDVPLPVPRPTPDGTRRPALKIEQFGPPLPPRPPSPVATSDAACVRVLQSGKILGESQAPIVGTEGCGVAEPLQLRAVIMPNGRRIAVEPPAIIRCDLAERLADWLREDIALIATPYGDLIGVADAAGYACRGRNHIQGAELSEHAHGNALDILSFRYQTHVIGLKDPGARAFLAQVNHTACSRFNTVLGPGSDGYHEDNLHLDLKLRKNASHYCHWEQS